MGSARSRIVSAGAEDLAGGLRTALGAKFILPASCQCANLRFFRMMTPDAEEHKKPPAPPSPVSLELTEAPETEAPPPPRKPWDHHVYDWWAPKWRRIRGPFLLSFFFVAFITILMWKRVVISIHSGETGVKWRRWSGTVTNRTYDEGLHLIWPFDRMYIYETRAQHIEKEFDLLTNDGLHVHLAVSIRYRPELPLLPLLHRNIGPEYATRVIIPEVHSTFRKIVGQYSPQQVYNSQGGILQNVVLNASGELLNEYIILDDLLLKEIRLPPTVARAIDSKLAEEQKYLEYEYRLERERQEATRKEIEADGVKRFQDVISVIAPEYLRYKGIEATLALAESANSKVIIVGSGDGGLPVIFNASDPQVPAPTAPLSAGLAVAPKTTNQPPPATNLLSRLIQR